MSAGSDFHAPTRSDWESLVQKITNGVVPEEALSTLTYDGFAIHPLYDHSDLADIETPNSALFSPQSWEIRQFLVLDEIIGQETAAEKRAGESNIMSQISAVGAEGVWLKILGSSDPKYFQAELFKDFASPDLDVRVFLDAGPHCFKAADAYLEAASSTPETSVSLNLDPLGVLARYGQLPCHPDQALADLAGYVNPRASNCRAIGVDTSVYAEAGATLGEQLSFALATGVNYLRCLNESGVDLKTAAENLEFTFAATPEMFATIAFLRAFRLCWQQVLHSSGFEDSIQQAGNTHIHAVSSASHLTEHDPWVNLLRTTAACFGAGVGGANSITILPFDYQLGESQLAESGATSRRLAVNISHIMKRESSLAKVRDAARGSFYFESFTHKLAKAGWERFQEIEAEGSMLDLLTSGKVLKIVQNSWERQKADIADRKKIIVGVSEFLNPDEATSERAPSEKTEKNKHAEMVLLSDPAYSQEPLPTDTRSQLYRELLLAEARNKQAEAQKKEAAEAQKPLAETQKTSRAK